MPAAWTASGACTSGSIARREDGTRRAALRTRSTGSAATTSTTGHRVAVVCAARRATPRRGPGLGAKMREHRQHPAVIVGAWRQAELGEDMGHVGLYRSVTEVQAL